MDTEESRPASSASNSSGSSGNSSSPSASPSPSPSNPKSPHSVAHTSPTSSGRRSRSHRRSSASINDDNSNSSSRSSSLSGIGEDNTEPALKNDDESIETAHDNPPLESRNNENSRSSGKSRPATPENDGDKSLGNDLSDVSDLESEKHDFCINSKSLDGAETPLLDATVKSNEESVLCNDEPSGQKELSVETNGNTDITDLRQKLDMKNKFLKQTENGNTDNEVRKARTGDTFDDLVKAHDEDALDFEAEEGECPEVKTIDDAVADGEDGKVVDAADRKKTNDNDSDGDAGAIDDLEEGEVSDEDEKRPEETEPKPVCRFYTRGQCTWGMSCRFMHPGVTDKGNYTMFDLVRPIALPTTNASANARNANYPAHGPDFGDYRSERPHHRPAAAAAAHSAFFALPHEPRSLAPETPVVVESAWERGLRTAKEMMRKATKRKEQDMDFEDKKMNLTLSPDEIEKEAYYLKERASPQEGCKPLPYSRYAVYPDAPERIDDRYVRHPPMPLYEEVDPYGRNARYRELPPHRMPHYEDERRVRPTREVIVQRVEPVGRGDEWNDPWMRSKSPGGRDISQERSTTRRGSRSYSSNSSYSTSSSSQSDSSSNSSHSEPRGRYNNYAHKAAAAVRKNNSKFPRSPSPQRGARAVAAPYTNSPMSKRRGFRSPTHPEKRTDASKYSKRKRVSSTKVKRSRRHTSSSSESGSSDSSASDSDSESDTSSTESSPRTKPKTVSKKSRVQEKVPIDKAAARKTETSKKRSPISIELKKQAVVGSSALASPTHSISSEKDSKKSRREELLKQLRAVEDAIAKKRSKLS